MTGLSIWQDFFVYLKKSTAMQYKQRAAKYQKYIQGVRLDIVYTQAAMKFINIKNWNTKDSMCKLRK